MSKKESTFFKKILLPTDGSNHSIKAAKYTIEIAKKCDSQVYLLHVLDLSVTDQPVEIGIDARIAVDQEEIIKEKGKKAMEKTKKIFDDAKIPVEVRYFGSGDPRRAILDAAEKENFDLIVMGSRGLGGVRRLMLGSVADSVIRHAKCPVLIVR